MMKNKLTVLALCLVFAMFPFVLAPGVSAKGADDVLGGEREGKFEIEIEDVEDIDDELGDELDDLDDELDDLEDELDEAEDDEDEDDNRGRGEEHRSEVANVVRELLEVARKNGGLGEEIRRIANEQASSTEEIAEAIEKIENRSGFKVFLIGTDYKNLGAIRSELSQMENRLMQLEKEAERLIPSERDIIGAEISAMQNEQDKLESFIEENEDKFSVFGWFVKLF